MDNSWTKQFKDKMEDYQEMAPEGLWESIREASVPASPKKRRPAIILRLIPAVTAAAAAIISGIVYFNNGNDTGHPDGLASNLPKEKPETTAVSDKNTVTEYNTNKYNEIDIVSSDGSIMSDAIIDTRASADMENKNMETGFTGTIPSGENAVSDDEYGISDSVNSGTSDNKDIGNNTDPDTADNKTDISGNGRNDETGGKGTEYFPEYYENESTASKRKRFGIGAAVSGAAGNSITSPGYSGNIAAASVNAFGTSPENEIRLFNRTREVTTGTNYRLPVKAGVSLRYYISNRWSISTGIGWTWLHSSVKEGSDSYYSSKTTDIHYIGIPLGANFDIWNGHGLKVYAGAGGEMEKCISGKNRTEYVYNSVPSRESSEKFMEKQLQWSVYGKAGLEYDFSPFAGIYLEPGVTWHFNNGSGIDNIYKSRPVNFSLSIGIRFNLR